MVGSGYRARVQRPRFLQKEASERNDGGIERTAGASWRRMELPLRLLITGKIQAHGSVLASGTLLSRESRCRAREGPICGPALRRATGRVTRRGVTPPLRGCVIVRFAPAIELSHRET